MPSDTKNPTSDITTSNWTPYPASPTTRYDKVDDGDSHDSDSTYVSHAEGDTVPLVFGFSAFAVPSDATILSVKVYSYQKTLSTSTGGELVKVGGTVYNGSLRSLSGSYVKYSTTWATNPKTTVAWTVDDVNGVGANAIEGFGVDKGGGGTTVATAVWIEVNYTMESASESPSKSPSASPSVSPSVSPSPSPSESPSESPSLSPSASESPSESPSASPSPSPSSSPSESPSKSPSMEGSSSESPVCY